MQGTKTRKREIVTCNVWRYHSMQGTRTRDERDGDPQATEVLGMRSRLATYMYIHTVHIHIHAHNSEMGSCSTRTIMLKVQRSV